MKCKYSQHSVSFTVQQIYWSRIQKQKRNYNYVILLPPLSQAQNSKHHGREHPDRSALFLFWLLLESPAYFVEIFLSQNLHIWGIHHTQNAQMLWQHRVEYYFSLYQSTKRKKFRQLLKSMHNMSSQNA